MLTPAQIKAYRFQSAGRGLYKSDEVDEIYSKVVASYEQMFKENSELIKRVGMLAERVEEYRRDEELIQKTLLIAQRKADEIEKDAQSSSAAKIAKAETRAKELRDEAEAYANEKMEAAQARAGRVLADAGERAERLISSAEKKSEEIIRNATGEAQGTLQRLKAEIAQSNTVLETLKKEHNELKASLVAAYERQLGVVRSLPELQDVSLDELYRTSIQSYEEKLAAMAREYEIKDEKPLTAGGKFTTSVISEVPATPVVPEAAPVSQESAPAEQISVEETAPASQGSYSFESAPVVAHDRTELERTYGSVDDLDFSKYSEDIEDDDDEESASFFAPAAESAAESMAAQPDKVSAPTDTSADEAPTAEAPTQTPGASGGFKIYMENVMADSDDDDDDDAPDMVFGAASRFRVEEDEEEEADSGDHRRKGFFGKK